MRRGDDLERLYERILVRSRRGCLFVFGLGGLGASDFLIECIDVGVLDHGVERLKNAVLEQRSVHTFRQVVKLLKRTLELGVVEAIQRAYQVASDAAELLLKIGRASCRERVFRAV